MATLINEKHLIGAAYIFKDLVSIIILVWLGGGQTDLVREK